MFAKLPKVGIVVSNYNYRNFIGDCIDSIFSQTYPYLDVVIIDDRSTDDSDFVIQDLRKKYNFKYQINPENSGQTVSLRNGVRALDIDAHFVHFIDADDVLLKTCIEDLVNMFLSVGLGYPFVYGLGNYIDEYGQRIAGQTHFTGKEQNIEDSSIVLVKPSLHKFPEYPIQATTSGIMFRKTAASLLLEHPESAKLRICTDGLLVNSLFYLAGSAYINKTIYNYRLHGNNNFLDVSVIGGLNANHSANLELHRTVLNLTRSLIRENIVKKEFIYFTSNFCSEKEFVQLGYKPKHISKVRSLGRVDYSKKINRYDKVAFALKKACKLHSPQKNILGFDFSSVKYTVF